MVGINELGACSTLDTRILVHRALSLLDHLRFIVEAANASRSMKKLAVCLTIEFPDEFSAEGGYPCNFEKVLFPVERLRSDIQLDLHVHWGPMGFDRDDDDQFPIIDVNIIDANTYALPPAKEYMLRLQKARDSFPSHHIASSLIDEWIHLRAWLSIHLPEFARPAKDQGVCISLMAEELRPVWRDVVKYDYGLMPESRKLLIDVWLAHNAMAAQRSRRLNRSSRCGI